jgi:rhamnose utilization protein RhaD (predicted bifunctional aldolase and dehydrogenase)
MDLQKLIELSREYGSNPDYVLGGGGNTSMKQGDRMYVKASGFSLGDITADGFVGVDLGALNKIWVTEYPGDPDERESRVLADLMDSRVPEDRDKRPSVETLMHALIPETYVVHTHPALINGVTCAQNGAEAVKELFPGEAAWVPLVNPGYVLANEVRKVTHEFKEASGKFPRLIFLQNHGVVVGSREPEEVRRLTDSVTQRISSRVKERPDMSPVDYNNDDVLEWEKTIRDYYNSYDEDRTVIFTVNREIKNLIKDEKSAAPVMSAFSPDHIVYAGHEPLFTDTSPGSQFKDRMESYRERNGHFPKVIIVQGLGVFAAGKNKKTAGLAGDLFLDAVKIAVYADSFGGYRFMPEDQISFIRNWEVERYRSNISEKE